MWNEEVEEDDSHVTDDGVRMLATFERDQLTAGTFERANPVKPTECDTPTTPVSTQFSIILAQMYNFFT